MPRRRRRTSRSAPEFTIARRLLRRRRMRWTTLVILLVLLVSAVLNRYARVGYDGDDWAAFDQKTYVVAEVVDGDTVRVRPAGMTPLAEQTPVRLLGIDAAEMNPSSPDPPEYWAQRATEALAQMAEGRQVVLRLEPTETRDRYDRLLAYLYEPDGDNLNLTLVEQGHVYADRRFKHTLRSQFEQAENQARRRGLGLWERVREEQMPAWRQRWLEERRGGADSNRDDGS